MEGTYCNNQMLSDAGNACCHSVLNVLFCYLLSKNVKIRIYKTIILSVVLYGCEILPLTLREEHRLEGLRIFEPKRDEVVRGWRKLHNEELHNLDSLPSTTRMIKSRRMRGAGHVACMWRKRNAYRILVGNPKGKRPLGRPRRRSEDNVQMDLREIGWGDLDWIDLDQDRDQWRALVYMVMNLLVP
jgi:hypothetical protein